MKNIEQLQFPDDLLYAEDHEWLRKEGGDENIVEIGISDYAQDQLGDVVFVELPEVGTEFDQNDAFGSIESVKAVSELYIPVSGKVIAVNSELENSPELVNDAPYGDGWLIKVSMRNTSELEALMPKAAYLENLKEH